VSGFTVSNKREELDNKISDRDLVQQRGFNPFLNENNYGVHINLTELSNDDIIELKNYINYVNTQENNLKLLETQKDNLRNFFTDKADPVDNSKLSKDNVRHGVSVLY
jgi:hypothetical protein